jgi:hypothetical protein
MKSPPIYTGRCISIHTITKQAGEFFADLDERERRDFEVAATLLDYSQETGRPPGGRSERVEDSKQRLFELRITPQGRRGKHTRALFIRNGLELLMVRGMRKAERGIPRREIELAERDAGHWRERRDKGGGKEERGRAA